MLEKSGSEEVFQSGRLNVYSLQLKIQMIQERKWPKNKFWRIMRGLKQLSFEKIPKAAIFHQKISIKLMNPSKKNTFAFQWQKQQYKFRRYSIHRRILPQYSDQARYKGKAMYEPAPTEYSASSVRSIFFEDNMRSTKYALKKDYKHFQYVNPKLVFEWEGTTKKKLIQGEGTFKAFEQSHDGVKKEKKLIFSLQAEKWKGNKPEGNIVMTHYQFYTATKPDSVIRQIRRYSGKCKNMKRQGTAEYIIELHYSNQNKDVFQINGQWIADYLVSGKISKNGGTPTNLNVFKNIENNNPRRASICGIARPLLKPVKKGNENAVFFTKQIEDTPKIGKDKGKKSEENSGQFEVKIQKVAKDTERAPEKSQNKTKEEEQKVIWSQKQQNEDRKNPSGKKEKEEKKRTDSPENINRYTPENFLTVPSQNKKVKHRSNDQSLGKK